LGVVAQRVEQFLRKPVIQMKLDWDREQLVVLVTSEQDARLVRAAGAEPKVISPKIVTELEDALSELDRQPYPVCTPTGSTGSATP
jgi:hypothetical protein